MVETGLSMGARWLFLVALVFMLTSSQPGVGSPRAVAAVCEVVGSVAFSPPLGVIDQAGTVNVSVGFASPGACVMNGEQCWPEEGLVECACPGPPIPEDCVSVFQGDGNPDVGDKPYLGNCARVAISGGEFEVVGSSWLIGTFFFGTVDEPAVGLIQGPVTVEQGSACDVLTARFTATLTFVGGMPG